MVKKRKTNAESRDTNKSNKEGMSLTPTSSHYMASTSNSTPSVLPPGGRHESRRKESGKLEKIAAFMDIVIPESIKITASIHTLRYLSLDSLLLSDAAGLRSLYY